MKNFRVCLLIILGLAFAYTANSFFSLAVKAQALSSDTSDAIAVRIIPNPNHYSISRWYESQGFSGAPQALIVDGYEAVRDGRTVYVNATNVDNKNIYTNIYLISYNQSSAEKTIDILGQIVNHWKFNSNITESVNPVPSCAISNKNCASDNDCGEGQACAKSGNASSSCVLKTPKNCLIDSDCPVSFFCNSLKSKIIRDAKRVGQLGELKEALFKYKNNPANNRFPTLGAGTYLINHSVSVWPSWSQNLLTNLAVAGNFLDPINRLGTCPGYDVKTCWDNSQNKFVFSPDQNYLKLPAGSYAFVYKSDSNGSNFNLCATLESRDPSLDYHFSPNDPSSSACIIDTGVISGGTATNTAPILIDKSLTGQAGQEFNGFIKVFDAENNPLTWTLLTAGTVWKNWLNNNATNSAPIFKDTNILNQKKIYASLAGDPGEYNIGLKVEDGQGGVLSTTTKIIITNSAPLIEADNGEYVLSAFNPFSYSFTFSDNYLADPAASFTVTKLSGPYDIWNESKTVSFTSIGSNKYKVTHSGIASTSRRFLQDTDFSYRIRVTDKYNVVTTKDFTLKVIVEKPVLDFNCSSKARIGKSYSCLLGPNYTNNRQSIFYSLKDSLFANLTIGTNQSTSVSISGIPAALSSLKTEISAIDEYGASTTRAFSLQVYNYCGDGIIQTPNTEGQGGFYNDGYEDCDGSAGVTNNVASSSIVKQYACSTKSGEITPDIFNSNKYCTYPPTLDGGGYCGDGYCSSVDAGGLENTCNCGKDCGAPINCPCTAWTYSDWGTCSDQGQQTRAIVTSSPNGCINGSPVLSQPCIPTCNAWTYSDWSTCSAQGTQSRTIMSSLPSNCSGGSPLITQPCANACHTQADCPNGFSCESNRSGYEATLYYCTGWEGSHGCTNASLKGDPRQCVNILGSNKDFSKCEKECNKLKAVTVNGIPNSGYCTWSVQGGICAQN